MSEGVLCTYCDGETLHSFTAHAEFFDNGFLRLTGENFQLFAAASQVGVSEKLGRLPYFLHMPEGGVVELPSCPEADALVSAIRPPSRLTQTRRALERLAPVTAVATILLVIGIITMLWRSQPFLARRVAFFVPNHVEAQAGLVGYSLFADVAKPTALNASAQLRLHHALERLVAARNFHLTPQIKLLRLGVPNTFALPGEILIVSDELVLLTANDDELAALLAHEIGHVENRHGLQSILRNDSALLTSTLCTGDFSAIASASALLPTLLLKNGYAPEFEREADAYATSLLRDAHINPHAFDSFVQRLEKIYPANSRTFTYLGTHPSHQ